MDVFVIHGGKPLAGQVRINGAKNAALPQMAAALLADAPLTLRDVPDVADVRNMARLLDELGCAVKRSHPESGESPYARTLHLNVMDGAPTHARYDIVRTMRASVCVLGPLLARRGAARVAMPGGCALGHRPIDIHLRGLRALGAEISLDGGDVVALAPRGRLRGGRVFLGGPNGSTVLGTANVMSAATLAEGRTVIECAACEPEVVDLATLLNAMGARISGAGSPRIVIEGVDSLGGAEHVVLPDRIEAGTLMCAGAITRGVVTLTNCPLDALMAMADVLERMGSRIDTLDDTDPLRAHVRVTHPGTFRPAEVVTQPHPGFPTDLQAQIMAVASLADGISVVTEKIFPERFLHVSELTRMGAQIVRQGPNAIVSGVSALNGAPVMASDLRASACLVLAGLAARGATVVNRVYHLDRGYAALETRLRDLGAQIERLDEKGVDQDLLAVSPLSMAS